MVSLIPLAVLALLCGGLEYASGSVTRQFLNFP